MSGLILPGDQAMMAQMQQREQNPMIKGLLMEAEKHKQIAGYLERLLIEALITLEKLNQIIQENIKEPPTLEVSQQLVQWWTQVRPQVMAQIQAQQALATEKTQMLSPDGKPLAVEESKDEALLDVDNGNAPGA